MEKDIEKFKEENNELFFMIQDLKLSNEKKYVELKNKNINISCELINEFENDKHDAKIKWVYSLKKDDYDKFILDKYNPDYLYIDESQYLSLLTKYYYIELIKLVKINNELVKLLGAGKTINLKTI